MGPVLIFLFVVLIGLLNVLFWLGNHRRIRREIEELGGKVLSIHWSPFGRGWLWTPRGAIIYRARYYDAEERLHDGHCRTDWLLGNRWTENRVVGEPGGELAGLDPRQKRAWLK